MVSAILPWPPKELFPNARVHWTVQRKKSKIYKESCYWQFRAASFFPFTETRHFKIDFCPPDARKRDLDNMLASFKAGIDGLALCLGVDDSEFQFTISKAPPVKGGAVRVEAI